MRIVNGLIPTGGLPVEVAGDTGDGQVGGYPVLAVGGSVTVRGGAISVDSDDGARHTVTITKAQGSSHRPTVSRRCVRVEASSYNSPVVNVMESSTGGRTRGPGSLGGRSLRILRCIQAGLFQSVLGQFVLGLCYA